MYNVYNVYNVQYRYSGRASHHLYVPVATIITVDHITSSPDHRWEKSGTTM